MLWGCFVASGAGNHVWVHRNMKKEDYVDTVKNNVKKSAAIVALGHRWVFYRTSRLVQKVLKDKISRSKFTRLTITCQS